MIDITTVPFSEFAPNSVLTVRAQSTTEETEALVHALRDHIPNTVSILLLQRDTEICYIAEEVLNAAGWMRKVDRIAPVEATD